MRRFDRRDGVSCKGSRSAASPPDSVSRACPHSRPTARALDAKRAVLTGRDFDLSIGELPVNFTGATRRATVVNGQLPAPLLRWRQGDTVTLRVRNSLPVTKLDPLARHHPAGRHGRRAGPELHGHRAGRDVHVSLHGEPVRHVLVPQPFALSGTDRAVRRRSSIEPRDGERFPAEREHVVLLSDWTDADPEHIYATLKKQSNYYNFGKPTAGDFLRDAQRARRRRGARRRGACGTGCAWIRPISPTFPAPPTPT